MPFAPDASVVPPNETILVAVSSGADSIALLLWLHDLGRSLVVGHVHHDLHELRPGECDADEEFVRQSASRLGLPFVSHKIDLPRNRGHVNESVARAGRYLALQAMAREHGCSRIATAHTASDALEGVLLNIGRGGGLNGWRGIAPVRPLEDGLLLVRPFWHLGREEVRDWLRERGEAWREDESNRSELFRRNRVRHEVLPLLADIFGREADTLARNFAANARLARDEADFLEGEAEKQLQVLVVRRQSDFLMLDGLKFRELAPALARRVLRLGAREIAPDFLDLEWSKVEVARLAVVENRKRAVWAWRNEVRVEWTGQGSGNRLRFWRVKP